VYSVWSLRTQEPDWAKLAATKKHRKSITPRNLRIIEHLRANRPRVII